jgi:hypothetical protein
MWWRPLMDENIRESSWSSSDVTRCSWPSRALIVIVVTLISLLVTGQAWSFSKVGTAAAQFLKIGVGARPAAMGGAFVALADDATALYWNPAGIVQVDQPHLVGSHAVWFADLSHEHIGVVRPIGWVQAVGVSATYLGCPEIEITTETYEDGTGEYFGYSDLAMGVTYARWLTDRFSVGLTGKYIQQNAHNETASTWAIDVATLLVTHFHGARIGMCLSNFGGNMRLEGPDLLVTSEVGGDIGGHPDVEAELMTESWPLPLNFRVGMAVDLMGASEERTPHLVTLAVDANHPSDGEERLNVGLEYGLHRMLFLRSGLKVNYDEQDVTWGAGIHWPLGERSIQIDYALARFGMLDNVHRISLGLGF